MGQLSVSTFYKGMLCESPNKGVHLSTPVCHHQQEEATPRYLTDSRSTKKLFTIKSKWIKIIPQQFAKFQSRLGWLGMN